MTEFDYALVGGGLQNGLLALALRARQPEARIAMVERESRLGGNHTWCYHGGDLAPRSGCWVEPLVVHRWPGYEVFFPGLERRIDETYAAISSDRFHTVVSARLLEYDGSALLLDTEVTGVGPDRVELSSGGALTATAVIDARGPAPPRGHVPAGYQKFLGLEFQLASPHDLRLPILMDARVDQAEGFRFLYVLPLGTHRLLVEDTYFHQSPSLVTVELRGRILRYAARQGWEVADVLREETGVLPMPWASGFRQPGPGPLVAGYRGGWFHPGTGYSFPVAARLAEFVAERPPETLFGTELRRFAADHLRQVTFTQLLNRFLFRWFAPASRREVFERFYRLPRETIGNFYALRLTSRDCYRLVTGRPPRGLSLRYRLRHGAER